MASTVLSIDVDYFVAPRVTRPGKRAKRPANKKHRIWQVPDVRTLLETHFRLSTSSPVFGAAAEDHDGIVNAIRGALARGTITAPFRLIHVDAHSDLGMGDQGYVTVLSDVLHRPEADRFDKLGSGKQGIGLGNWLAFLAAARLIAEVVIPPYVVPRRDEMPVYFAHCWPARTSLRLVPLSTQQLKDWTNTTLSLQHIAGLPSQEPHIPWSEPLLQALRLDRPPDFVFVCRSPAYSPQDADAIFDLVREYIR